MSCHKRGAHGGASVSDNTRATEGSAQRCTATRHHACVRRTSSSAAADGAAAVWRAVRTLTGASVSTGDTDTASSGAGIRCAGPSPAAAVDADDADDGADSDGCGTARATRTAPPRLLAGGAGSAADTGSTTAAVAVLGVRIAPPRNPAAARSNDTATTTLMRCPPWQLDGHSRQRRALTVMKRTFGGLGATSRVLCQHFVGDGSDVDAAACDPSGWGSRRCCTQRREQSRSMGQQPCTIPHHITPHHTSPHHISPHAHMHYAPASMVVVDAAAAALDAFTLVYMASERRGILSESPATMPPSPSSS
jgi:hypothetical protein